MARRRFFTVDEALPVALGELELDFVGYETLDNVSSDDGDDSSSEEHGFDEQRDSAGATTRDGVRNSAERGESDDDGDGLHFLDIGVDPAVRATAFIGSSGGCSFYLQHCLKSLFCSTMCND